MTKPKPIEVEPPDGRPAMSPTLARLLLRIAREHQQKEEEDDNE